MNFVLLLVISNIYKINISLVCRAYPSKSPYHHSFFLLFIIIQRGSKIVGWLKTVDNFITTNGNDLIFCGIIEIGCPILSRGFASWGPSPPYIFFCYKIFYF